MTRPIASTRQVCDPEWSTARHEKDRPRHEIERGALCPRQIRAARTAACPGVAASARPARVTAVE